MQTLSTEAVRPPIHLIDTEAEALSSLALSSSASSMGARLLLEELERAEISDRDALPANVATMMSHVLFEDEATGRTREVQLVYPRDADSERDRISIITPIGAALIGMPEGANIEWPNRSGAKRSLRILKVTRPEPGA